MSTIHRFEEIEAWQTARALTKIVYEFTASGSFARDFGLRDQMRRASVSIMSNIAEGFESRTSALFLEFLARAKGSAGELRAQFYVAQDAGYLTSAQHQGLQDQCEKCSSQISRFMAYLRTNAQNHSGAEAPQRSAIPGVKRSNVSTFKCALCIPNASAGRSNDG